MAAMCKLCIIRLRGTGIYFFSSCILVLCGFSRPVYEIKQYIINPSLSRLFSSIFNNDECLHNKQTSKTILMTS